MQTINAELLKALKHAVRWHDQLSANDVAYMESVIARVEAAQHSELVRLTHAATAECGYMPVREYVRCEAGPDDGVYLNATGGRV